MGLHLRKSTMTASPNAIVVSERDVELRISKSVKTGL